MAGNKSSAERLADLIAELLADAADKAVDKAARKAVGEELALRMVEGTHQPMLYTIAETAALLGGVSETVGVAADRGRQSDRREARPAHDGSCRFGPAVHR